MIPNNQRAFVAKIHLVGGGEPILVGMGEREARDLLIKHKTGTLDPVIGDTGAALPWTIRSSDIKAVQLFPADMMVNGQQGQLPWTRGSGLN